MKDDNYEKILSKESVKSRRSYNIPNCIKDINIIAKENDTFIGGLIGKLNEDSLHIDLLVVDEQYRKQGIGINLMSLAEEIATNNNITMLDLSTAEFQAKGFYESLGFEVICVRENYPKGYKNYKLTKSLN